MTEKGKRKVKLKLSERMRRNLLLALMAMLFGGVLAVCTMCLSYVNGRFMMSGLPMLAVWVIYSFLYGIASVFCRVYSMDRIKNVVVIYVSSLLTILLAIACLRYMTILFVPLLVAGLLTTLLVDKRSGYIALTVTFGAVLVMYLVWWMNGGTTLEPIQLLFLLLKLAGAELVLALYRTDFNRINLIAEVVIVGVIVGLLGMALSMVLQGDSIVESALALAWLVGSYAVSLLLCLVLSPILEWVLRLETNMKLLEYISFDQPLLKEMAVKAPGTFHHSLAVGNLAERCANAIGENVNLAKAASYYHDVGKLQTPEFFTENQQDGYNPHDDLTYENSVMIITRHTEVGYKMLTEKHFPKILADVAREHHGDTTVGYFYIKAKNITEGEVDSANYRYPGPKPSSRIAAIVMIADTVEAATRSKSITDRDELYKFIDKLIADKRESGQFDNCDITMRDLAVIRDTLVDALVGVYHKRINYPEQKKQEKIAKMTGEMPIKDGRKAATAPIKNKKK